jgi:hypothetical protein
MDFIEVKLLKYTFRFKPLLWREEFEIAFAPGEDRLRTYLAYALVEVSGIKIKSIAEAKRVLAPIPVSIIQRVYIIYRGSLVDPRLFTTIGLYKAPEAKAMALRFMEAEKETDAIMDRVEREMEQKFGRKELEDARELERKMAQNSKMRGATKASPDTDRIRPEKP